MSFSTIFNGDGGQDPNDFLNDLFSSQSEQEKTEETDPFFSDFPVDNPFPTHSFTSTQIDNETKEKKEFENLFPYISSLMTPQLNIHQPQADETMTDESLDPSLQNPPPSNYQLPPITNIPAPLPMSNPFPWFPTPPPQLPIRPFQNPLTFPIHTYQTSQHQNDFDYSKFPSYFALLFGDSFILNKTLDGEKLEGMSISIFLTLIKNFLNTYPDNPSLEFLKDVIPDALEISLLFASGKQKLESILKATHETNRQILKEEKDGQILKEEKDGQILKEEEDGQILKEEKDRQILKEEKDKIFKKLSGEFAHFIVEKIKSLSTNQTLLIPGGWTTAYSGHTIYCEITRNLLSFTFSVFNRGNGSYYHSQIHEFNLYDSSVRKSVVPVIELSDISLEEICNVSAWEIFYGLLVRTAICPPVKSENFYFGFLQTISPRFGLNPISKTSFQKKKQRSGTCTYKSFAAYCCSKLNKNEWRQLKLNLRLFLLNQAKVYFQTYLPQKSDSYQHEIAYLIKQGLQKFSLALQKDFQWLKDVAFDVQSLLKMISEINGLANQLMISKAPKIATLPNLTSKLEHFYEQNPIQKKFYRFFTTSSESQNKLQLSLNECFIPIISEHFTKDVNELSANLLQLLTQVRKLSLEDDPERCIYSIEKIFNTLPPVDFDNPALENRISFWRSIPLKDISSIMESLVGLSDLLLLNQKNKLGFSGNPFPPNHLYLQQKILAILHQLFHIVSPSEMEGITCNLSIPFLTHRIHNDFSSKSPLFAIFDPQTELEVFQTLSYFASLPKGNLFENADGEVDLFPMNPNAKKEITEKAISKAVIPEIKLLFEFFKSPKGEEAKSKIIQYIKSNRHLDFDQISNASIVAIAMSDTTGEFGMPSIYCHLKKQYILTLITSTASSCPQKQKTDEQESKTDPKSFIYTAEVNSKQESSTDPYLKFSVPGVKINSFLNSYRLDQDFLNHFYYINDENMDELFSNYRNIFGRNLESYRYKKQFFQSAYKSEFVYPLGTNQNAFLFSKVPSDLEYGVNHHNRCIDEHRREVLLGCPDDKSFQAIKVINYFQQNREYLSRKDYQLFCKFLLFEPGILKKRLLAHPSTAFLCIDFCHSTFQFFNKQLKIEPTLFILEIGANIDAYLRHINCPHRVFSPSFIINDGQILDSPQAAYEYLLSRDNFSESEKNLIYLSQIKNYLDFKLISWETLPFILRNILCLENLSYSNVETSYVHSFEKILFTTVEFIQNELSLRESETIIKLSNILSIQIYQFLQRNSPVNMQWNFSHFPEIISEDESVIFNLITGELKCLDGFKSTLPKGIKGSDIFAECFNGINNLVYNSGVYYFNDNFNAPCMVSSTSHVNYKRKFEGKEFIAIAIQIKGFNFHLYHELWSDFLENTQYPTLSTAWIDSDNTEIILLNCKKEKMPVLRFHIPTCSIVSEIYLDPNTQEKLLLAKKEPNHPFNTFDTHYEIWMNKSQLPVLICFPNFDLSFDIKNGIAFSKEFPSFFLESLSCEEFPKLNGMLLALKNARNEYKIIVPRNFESTDFHRKSISGKIEFKLINKKQSYYVFGGFKSQKGIFHRDEEPNLYLVYLYALHKNDKMMETKLKFIKKFDFYTITELEIFLHLFNYAKLCNDAKILSLTLQAAIIYIENIEKHCKSWNFFAAFKSELIPNSKLFIDYNKENFKTFLIELYSTYSSQINNAGEYALTKDQKKFILEFIIKEENDVLYSSELNFLETKKTPTLIPERFFRHHKIINFKKDKKTNKLNYNFESLKETEYTLMLPSSTNDENKFNNLNVFVENISHFIVSYFLQLYRAAQSPTLSDRQKVKAILSSNRFFHGEQLHLILSLVSANPPCIHNEKYQYKNLETAIKNKNELNSLLEELFNKAIAEIKANQTSLLLNRLEPRIYHEKLNTVSSIPLRNIINPFINPTDLNLNNFIRLPNSLSTPIFSEQFLYSNYCISRPPEQLFNDKSKKQRNYSSFTDRLNLRISSQSSNRVIRKELLRLQNELKIAHTNQVTDEFYFDCNKISSLKKDLADAKTTLISFSNENLKQMFNLKYKQMNIPLEVRFKIDLDSTLGLQECALEEFIPLYQNGWLSHYLQKFPFLSQNELISIHFLIESELLIQTRLQHIVRIEGILSDLDHILLQNGSMNLNANPYFQLLNRNLLNELTRQRAYSLPNPTTEMNQQNRVHVVDPQLFSSLLVLEYYQEILLLPQQIHSLKILLNPDPSNRAIVQLKTGSGKSKVFFPILAFKKANGINLSILMILQELMPSDSRDMQITNAHLFGQVGHRLNWNDTSKEGLQLIEQKLNEIIREKEYLMVTSNEMHLFILRYTSAKLAYQSKVTAPNAASRLERIQLFHNILEILKTKGDLPIDEIDATLYCRFKVNIPHGQAKKIDQERHEIATFIYEILLLESDITKYVNFEFFNQNGKGRQNINSDLLEKIKPNLVDLFLKKLTHPLPLHLESQKGVKLFSSLLREQNLSENDFKQVCLYLLSSPQYFDGKDIILDFPPKLQEYLSLTKEKIKSLWTLTKECNVNYGLFKGTKEILAGPFAGANKPRYKSQFGNYIELMLYTIQAYLREGIPENIVKNIISSLQSEAITDVLNGSEKFIEKTQANHKFLQICNHNQKYNLCALSDTEINEILQLVNRNTLLVLSCIHNFILPNITSFLEQLQSNASMLPDMFYRVQGVTATPTNIETLDDDFKFYPSEGSDGQAFLAISLNHGDHPTGFYYSNSEYEDSGEMSPNEMDVKESKESKQTPVLSQACSNQVSKATQRRKLNAINLLNDFLKHATEATFALVDSGSLFKDLTNQEVAKFILEFKNQNGSNNIQGVLYFNEDDVLMFLRANGESYKFQKGVLEPSNYFAFFDQKHTTGIDLLFIPTAQAIVTFNQNSLAREVLQGSGRLRQLLNGQSVIFMGKASDAKLIQTYLNLSQDPDKIDLLIYFMINQAINISSDNVIAIKQKMKAVPFKIAREINRGMPLNDLSHPAFIDLEKLFVMVWDDMPFQEFGSIERLEPSLNVLQRYKQNIIAKFFGFLIKFGNYLDRSHMQNLMISDPEVEIEGVETKSADYKPKKKMKFEPLFEFDSDQNEEMTPSQIEINNLDLIRLNEHLKFRPSTNNYLLNIALRLVQNLDAIINKALETDNERIPELITTIHNDNIESTVEQSHEVDEEQELDQEEERELEFYEDTERTDCGYDGSREGLRFAKAPPPWKNMHLLFTSENFFELSNTNARRFSANKALEFNKLINEKLMDIIKSEIIFSENLWLSENFLHTVVRQKDFVKKVEVENEKKSNKNSEKNVSDSEESDNESEVEIIEKPPQNQSQQIQTKLDLDSDNVEKVYNIFDYYQKNIDTFLVTKSNSSPNYDAILLSGKEANDLDIFLKEQRQRGVQEPNPVNVCLYYPNLGVVQGDDLITNEALKNSKQFQMLLVQIKFLKKEIKYSRQEGELLKQWFKSFKNPKTANALEQIFVVNALEWEQETYSNYPGSTLASIFSAIRKEQYPKKRKTTTG